jgi:hypothetical protein
MVPDPFFVYRGDPNMYIILVVLLVLLLVGALPTWPHAANWGYGPSGVITLLIIILLVLLLTGRL